MEYTYAIVKNSTVDNILVFEDPTEELLSHFKNALDAESVIDVTDNEYCQIGMSWDGISFKSPQPYPSWTFNEDLKMWTAPTPRPSINGNETYFEWNEDSLAWVEVIL